MISLLPCPFCGESGDTVRIGKGSEMHPADSRIEDTMTVVCDLSRGGCGAHSAFGPEEEVCLRWNRRVPVATEVEQASQPMELEEVDQNEEEFPDETIFNVPDDFSIGQTVKYVPLHAGGDISHIDCMIGVVTSKNDDYIFVAFNGSSDGQACNPGRLLPVN